MSKIINVQNLTGPLGAAIGAYAGLFYWGTTGAVACAAAGAFVLVELRSRLAS